ncbi:patatin-like phospholipase family protein [Kistimonas asteriae]|uniref:patatin-like phospholipase family protein n=1 Tax=Kistimonas asteriae TaxID=517724 RepID=UPI001BA4D9D1|nr:patatin-like phospholipase family protein [Kistimonas asteriae]
MAKTVSLVLGSGGARGYAHIGVIDELLARGYEISAIAGCSMGALVGGLYAAGRLEAYREWVMELKYLDVIRLLDLSFRSPGVFRGGRVLEAMSGMVGDCLIEDLRIPYTAVATDLNARKEIWFQEGDLLQAIRASIAIPSLFTPVEYNGRLLVDGGVLNPIPIAPTVSAHTDLIIAVDLNADIAPLQIACDPVPAAKEQRILERWFRKLKKSGSDDDSDESMQRTVELASGKTGMLDIVNQSLEIMQEVLTRHQMAAYSADVLIPVSARQCRFYEFHRAEDLIQVGRLQAASLLDQYPQFAVSQAEDEVGVAGQSDAIPDSSPSQE